MNRPCSDCPFRRGSPFERGLSRERVREIADGLRGDSWFPCHKTTGVDGGVGRKAAWCAGALGTMANEGIAHNNAAVRMAIAFGLIRDPADLKECDLLYSSLNAWEENHEDNTTR